jgi:O-acetyl-ADP-ribose deacetylase (regulator of RNase III)
MILTHGNLLAAQVDALVNTVNTEGVMGKGIAYQFQRAYPDMYQAYLRAHRNGELQVGKMHVFEIREPNGGPRFIINFPTKQRWRLPSRLEYIAAGLESLKAEIRQRGIKSIAIPPLGCGNGGLSWSQVLPLIKAMLADLPDVEALIFEPKGPPPASDMQRSPVRPTMTPSRAVLVALMDRYVKGLMNPLVTLLEVQKLMYFMQEAGEALNLRYAKANYGPFARNLKPMLLKMEGYFISGMGDASESPFKVIELVEGAVEQAHRVLAANEDTAKRMDRVVELIDGYESGFGMELLATVHWVMVHDEEARKDAGRAVAGVRAWSDRKGRTMSEAQIISAWEQLRAGDWNFLSTSMAERP